MSPTATRLLLDEFTIGAAGSNAREGSRGDGGGVLMLPIVGCVLHLL